MKALMRNQTKGQALVEFALVVPVLFFLILGAFDLGFAVYARNTVSLSAREGARYAITHRMISTVDTDVCQRVQDTSAALNVTCQVNWVPGKTQGSIVTVTVTYLYNPFVPIVGGLLGQGNLTFTGQSQMVVE